MKIKLEWHKCLQFLKNNTIRGEVNNKKKLWKYVGSLASQQQICRTIISRDGLVPYSKIITYVVTHDDVDLFRNLREKKEKITQISAGEPHILEFPPKRCC